MRVKFRNLGIEEFRDFSRPGSIPESLNSQFLNVQIPHLYFKSVSSFGFEC